METPKYKTIVSALDSSCEGFEEYLEMSKRINLFIDTDGASEPGAVMDISCITQFAALQDKLYQKALEKKKDESC